MEILTLAGREYAIGLNWLMLPEGGSFEKRVDRLTEDWESKPSHCVVYKPKSQVGLAHADGYKIGKVTALAPLAAAVAAENWVGLFAIGDGKAWMLKIVDSVIDPDGDRVMAMEDAIEEARRIKSQGRQTSQILLDDIDGSIRALEAIAQEVDVRAPLRRIPEGGFGRRRKSTIGISAAVVFAMIGGAVAWHLHTAHVAAERARMAQLRMHMAMLIKEEAERARELAPPWDAWPKPLAVVSNCVRYIYNLPIAHNGWILQRAGCGFEVGISSSEQTGKLPEPSGTLTVLIRWKHSGYGFTALPSAGSAPEFNPQQPSVIYASAHISYPSTPVATQAAYSRKLAAAPLFGFAADVGASLKTGSWAKVPGKKWSWIGYRLSWEGISTPSLMRIARELPKKVPGGVVQGVEWDAKGVISVSGVVFAMGLPPHNS